MNEHMKLMIPGPIDIFEETLEALGRPVRAHYSESFLEMYRDTVAMAQQIFQTKNDIIIMTAPGSGALDAGVSSLFSPGEKVAIANNGFFAIRMINAMKAFGLDVLAVDDDWGQASDVNKMRRAIDDNPSVAGIVVIANDTGTGVVNPVEEYARLAREKDLPIFVDAVSAMGGYDLPVDKWELDVVCTSSNKALETAPGLGVISVSERAWKIIGRKSEGATHRGWYYDLSRWKAAIDGSPEHPYPTTQASNMIVSLHASLNRIVNVETVVGHWARYAWARDVFRAGIRNLGFDPIAADDIASPTVTTFKIRDDMENNLELRDYLLKHHDILVAVGMGSFGKTVLRAGHMGKAGTREYLIPALLGIEDFVRDVKGQDIPQGAGLVGLAGRSNWH